LSRAGARGGLPASAARGRRWRGGRGQSRRAAGRRRGAGDAGGRGKPQARCASASARRTPRRTSGAAAVSSASLPPRRAGRPRRRDRRAGRRARGAANRALTRPRVRASGLAACSICEPAACACDLLVARKPACMGRSCICPAQARQPGADVSACSSSRPARPHGLHSILCRRGARHMRAHGCGVGPQRLALAGAGAHTLRQACPRVLNPECFRSRRSPLDAQLQPGLRLCLAHRLRVWSRPVVLLSS